MADGAGKNGDYLWKTGRGLREVHRRGKQRVNLILEAAPDYGASDPASQDIYFAYHNAGA